MNHHDADSHTDIDHAALEGGVVTAAGGLSIRGPKAWRA